MAIFSVNCVSDAEFLSSYMLRCLEQMGGDNNALSFIKVFFNTAKYHIAVIFFGFSVIGFICIPLLSAVKGFFFTFSIAVIIRLYGGNGVLLALALCGVNALIALPCYFIMASLAFNASKNLFLLTAYPGQRSYISPFQGRYFACCLVCLAALFIATVTDVYFTSRLVQIAVGSIV